MRAVRSQRSCLAVMFSHRKLLSASLLFLAASSVSAQKLYWVSNDCSSNITDSIKEVIWVAGRISQSLEGDSQPEWMNKHLKWMFGFENGPQNIYRSYVKGKQPPNALEFPLHAKTAGRNLSSHRGPATYGLARGVQPADSLRFRHHSSLKRV